MYREYLRRRRAARLIILFFLFASFQASAQRVFFSKDTVNRGYDSLYLYNSSNEIVTLDSIRILESPCENGFDGYLSFATIDISEIGDPYTNHLVDIGPDYVLWLWGDPPVIASEHSLIMKRFEMGQTNFDEIKCTKNDTLIAGSIEEDYYVSLEFQMSDGNIDTLVYFGYINYLFIDEVINPRPCHSVNKTQTINLSFIRNVLKLAGTKRGARLSIFNLNGKLIKYIALESDDAEISNLPSGSGMLMIEDRAGRSLVRYINVR